MTHTGTTSVPAQSLGERGWTLLDTALLLCYIFAGLGIKLSEKDIFFSPCCSHSTAYAVTQTATSWFQVLDTQCEIHTHTYVWDIWVGTNLTVSFVTIPWTLRKAKKAAVILLKSQNTTSYWFLFCRYKLRQNLMTASVLGRTLSQRLEWHRELNLITF